MSTRFFEVAFEKFVHKQATSKKNGIIKEAVSIRIEVIFDYPQLFQKKKKITTIKKNQ